VQAVAWEEEKESQKIVGLHLDFLFFVVSKESEKQGKIQRSEYERI